MEIDEELKEKLDNQRPLEEVLKEFDEQVAQRREQRRQKRRQKRRRSGAAPRLRGSPYATEPSALYTWCTYGSLFFESWLSPLPGLLTPLLLLLTDPAHLFFPLFLSFLYALSLLLLSPLSDVRFPAAPSGDVTARLFPYAFLHVLLALFLLFYALLSWIWGGWFPAIAAMFLLFLTPACAWSADARDQVLLHAPMLRRAERSQMRSQARLIASFAAGASPPLLLLAATAVTFVDARVNAAVAGALAVVGAASFGALAVVLRRAALRDGNLPGKMVCEAARTTTSAPFFGSPPPLPVVEGKEAWEVRQQMRVLEQAMRGARRASPKAVWRYVRAAVAETRAASQVGGGMGTEDGVDKKDVDKDGVEPSPLWDAAPLLLVLALWRFSALSVASVPLQLLLAASSARALRGEAAVAALDCPPYLALLGLLLFRVLAHLLGDARPNWLFGRAESALKALAWAPALLGAAAAACVGVPGMFAGPSYVFLVLVTLCAISVETCGELAEECVRKREKEALERAGDAEMGREARKVAGDAGALAMGALAVALGQVQALPFVMIPSMFSMFLGTAIMLFWMHLYFRHS